MKHLVPCSVLLLVPVAFVCGQDAGSKNAVPLPELIERLALVKHVGVLRPDPTEDELVRRGDAAVGPLLDCLAHDERMTEAFEENFNASRPKKICPVYKVAFDALEKICRHSFFDAAYGRDGGLLYRGQAGRAQLADIIRAYWNKNQSVPVLERCFETLKDDHAGGSEWLQAAEYIVRPKGISTTLDEEAFPVLPPAEANAFRGEPLRGRINPSVGELLARRIDDIAALPDDQWSRNLDDAARLTDMLFTWDGNAAAEVRRACNLMITRDAGSAQRVPVLVNRAIALTLRLMARGTLGIWDDYLRWLKEVPPGRVEGELLEWFRPLWQHPEMARCQQAAEDLFTAERSPWIAFLPVALRNNWLGEWMPTPMLGLAGFRACTLRMLSDRSRTGLSRTCDLCTRDLSTVQGMPKIELNWTEARRDEAVAECIETLRRNGDRYRFSVDNAWKGPAYAHPLRLEPPPGNR